MISFGCRTLAFPVCVMSRRWRINWFVSLKNLTDRNQSRRSLLENKAITCRVRREWSFKSRLYHPVNNDRRASARQEVKPIKLPDCSGTSSGGNASLAALTQCAWSHSPFRGTTLHTHIVLFSVIHSLTIGSYLSSDATDWKQSHDVYVQPIVRLFDECKMQVRCILIGFPKYIRCVA